MGVGEFILHDSGKRREFGTGSVRDTDDGKGNPSLMSVFALRRYAQLLQRGAKKYSSRNWEKGQPDTSYMDSLMRHVFAYMEGRREEDHLAAIIWNAAGLIHNEELVKRGLYPETFHDLADYTSMDAFDRTVRGGEAETCQEKKK
jgi:hypothetical protein